MNIKSLILSLLIGGALIGVTSCSSDEPLDPEQTKAHIENALTSLNIRNAQAIYYKGSNSRAGEDDNGYYKLDTSGNEVKLEISDDQGKVQNIRIDKMVKLSDRYLLLQPNFYDLRAVIEKSHDNWQDGEYEIMVEACSITCIVDNQTGTLYKIPRIGIGENAGYDNTTVSTVNGISYFNGYYYSEDYMADGMSMQIFKFNPNELTITALLPEYQTFSKFTVNDLGFVGYYEYQESASAKVKCPGGSIVQLGTDDILTISNNFYTIENNIIKRWTANGSNGLTSADVCAMPDNASTLKLANHLQDVYLFYGYTEAGKEATYQFNGKEFTLLDVAIPQELYTVGFETRDAWYNAENNMKLQKLSKVDYSISSIDISGYQIVEFVASPESPDVSFTGIRYSDSKKVIGKIDADNNIEIESAFTSGSSIYDLIPIN